MRRAIPAAALLTVLATCGGGSPGKPTDPVPVIDLAGTWAGSASDSTGPGTMMWVLTKTQTGASGPATTRTPLGSAVMTGTISLEQTGTSATWRIEVPAGGVTGMPTCTVTVTGTATLAPTTITGTYSGTGSCTDAFSGGTVSLSKQMTNLMAEARDNR